MAAHCQLFTLHLFLESKSHKRGVCCGGCVIEQQTKGLPIAVLIS